MNKLFSTSLVRALNLTSFPFINPSFPSHFFSTSTVSFSNLGNQFLSDEQAQHISSVYEEFDIKSSEYHTLKLKDGEFKYLHDLKLPHNVKWTGPEIKIKTLGVFKNADLIIRNLQELLSSFNKEQSYSILFVVQTIDSFYTLDRQYLVNYNSNAFNIIKKILELEAEKGGKEYGSSAADVLVCKYRPLYLKLKEVSQKRIIKANLSKQHSSQIPAKFINPNLIPFTMDLRFYGNILESYPESNSFLYVNGSSSNRVQFLITILESKNHHKVDVLGDDSSTIKFSFVDQKFDDYFIRAIVDRNSKKLIYLKFDFKFNLLHAEYPREASFLPPLTKKDLVKNNKILSFDIETYLDSKNNSIPYACGFYDGKDSHLFYLTDFESPKVMLLKCIEKMMSPKYKNYTVYAHNFSSFDSVFLYSLVYSYYKVKFLSKDNHILSLIVSSKNSTPIKQRSKLIFRDSARLLPDTLRDLGIAFKVPVNKGIFPYSFPNANNLSYIGSVPSFSYYNNDFITLIAYTKQFLGHSHSTSCTSWSLREETLSYLTSDLISLHQIILSANNVIFSNYRLNISNFPTISSLALGIYRTNFMKDNSNIVILKGIIDKAVRSAYYGGATDVYIPQGNNLFYYDANSLYPTAMLAVMPVGNPIYSTIKDLRKIFGFVYATVTSPGLKVPILPFKKPDGTLTFPNGTWTGWFFSEELKQAVEIYGYKAEIHESYIFERGYDIFKDYVDTMGAIKQSSEGATRKIHKLLMNSLYGRFGMSNEPELIKVLTSDKARELHLAYRIIENFPLTEDLEYIRCSAFPDPELCEQSGLDFNKLSVIDDHVRKEVLSSSPIAAATTAYARMIMNKVKHNYGVNIYYTDTDSIVTDKPLSERMIGNALGQFKLEYPKIKKAVFAAPKLYLLVPGAGEIISRGKGYSGTLSIIDYLELYEGKTIQVVDKRWLKNFQLSTVAISDRILRIAPVFNKRNKLISLGKWIDTSPLCVNSDGTISPLDLIIYSGPPISLFQQFIIRDIYRSLNHSLLPYPTSKSSRPFTLNSYYPLMFHIFRNTIIYIFQDHIIFYYSPPGSSNDIMRNQYYHPVTVKLLHSNLHFFMCMPSLYQKVVDFYYLEGHPLLNEFPLLSNSLFDPRDLRETLREITQLARNRPKKR